MVSTMGAKTKNSFPRLKPWAMFIYIFNQPEIT